MKQHPVFKFIVALVCCLLIGCAAALGLYLYDRHFDLPAPIMEGQTIDFSTYGFMLTVPDSYALNDYTTNNFAEGGDALFAGCAYGDGQELYLYCYANGEGDNIATYSDQELVSHYMSAGAQQVRTRTLGGRTFICYRVEVAMQDGTEIWDTYETWDETNHLVIETRMSPRDALAILQTIAFSSDGQTAQ